MHSIKSNFSKTEDLLRLLKSTGQEVSKLIEVARELLSNTAHTVPRKVHFLLDWTTNLLIKTSNRHAHPENALKEGYGMIRVLYFKWEETT